MYDARLNVRQPRIEWTLLLAILGLMIVGAAFIYSAAGAADAASSLPWWRYRHVTQIAYYLFGLSAATAVCLLPYHVLSRWALVAYWLTIICLVAVLIPGIGKKMYGARRWIDLGFYQFQPSEFAKLSFIFVLANFLSRPAEELRLPGIFIRALGMTLLPFLLILKEPDLGSALVLLPVGFAMMYAAGVPPSYLFRVAGAATLLVGLLLIDVLFAPPQWQVRLEDYQRHRLLVYFGRDFANKGASEAEKQRARELQREKSYNVEQALISVGSGGLTGKGWGRGTQSALGYLPRRVAHNDFIFSVIAEEKGFAGSVTVLTLYALILFTGIRIADQARDRLGRLLSIGVVTLIFSHVFINIGMNIRIMPVTGIPLPLLSHGGSAVLCSLIAMAILQNVYLYRRSY